MDLKAERKRLEADLAAAEKPPESVALHPTALARYRQQVDDLQKALSADASGDNREPINALRELVAAIMVLKTPPRRTDPGRGARQARRAHRPSGISCRPYGGGKSGSGGGTRYPPPRKALN
jgi:site-specific DNA recombinase